jgi:hypothetical protein
MNMNARKDCPLLEASKREIGGVGHVSGGIRPLNRLTARAASLKRRQNSQTFSAGIWRLGRSGDNLTLSFRTDEDEILWLGRRRQVLDMHRQLHDFRSPQHHLSVVLPTTKGNSKMFRRFDEQRTHQPQFQSPRRFIIEIILPKVALTTTLTRLKLTTNKLS